MHMDVVDGLPAILVAVHHHTKTLIAALLVGQALGGVENVAGQGFVVFAEVVEGGDMLFRDHQEVHRRLWANIVKRDNLVVFIKLARGNIPGDDLAEQTVHGLASGGQKGSRSLTTRAVDGEHAYGANNGERV